MNSHALSRAATLGLMLLAETLLVAGQDENAPAERTKPAAPSRTELRDRQLDVSLEARDIERILTRLKRASELAKSRITEAATVSESVGTSLDRGDSEAARKDAEQAVAMFREIAKQLEALLAEETPQRVAAARNLAAQLTRMERQFAQQLQNLKSTTQNGTGQGTPEEPLPKSTKGQGGAQQPKPESSKAAAGGTKPKAEETSREGAGTGTPNEPKNPPTEKPSGVGAGDPPMPPDKPDGRDPVPGLGTKPGAEPSASDSPEGDKPAGENPDGDKPGGDKPKSQGAGSVADEPTPNRADKSGGGTTPGDDTKPPPGGSGSGPRRPMTEEERRDALEKRAAELAENGATLLDILRAIAASTEPADQDAVAKVNALLQETKLEDAVRAMKEAAEQIADRQVDDARLAALDIADRMEITAQRLDAAYRLIVAPQAEELRKLEQQLATLAGKLNDLQTEAQIAAWHREARELLDRADQLGVSPEVREAIEDEMKRTGISPGGVLNRSEWNLVNGRYVPPAGYAVKLLELQEEIQARIQGLLLGDIVSAADEATPPKYQGLVERYYEVLSRDGRDTSQNVFRKLTAQPAKTGGKETPR